MGRKSHKKREICELDAGKGRGEPPPRAAAAPGCGRGKMSGSHPKMRPGVRVALGAAESGDLAPKCSFLQGPTPKRANFPQKGRISPKRTLQKGEFPPQKGEFPPQKGQFLPKKDTPVSGGRAHTGNDPKSGTKWGNSQGIWGWIQGLHLCLNCPSPN